MKKPIWTPKLGAVLFVETQRQKRKSKKGTEYETDVVPEYPCIIIGSPTEKHDEEGNITGYGYQVYDPIHDLGGFEIVAPNKLEGTTMSKAIFYGVRGGALQSRSEGWFKADKVELINK